jgi:CRP-like cAMP-binding protein
VLAQTELFAALPADQLAELQARVREIRLERGDELFRKGDDAAECFVVVDGRVAISARASDGRESVVAVLGPGQLIGEMPLFDGGPRSADARALTPSMLQVVSYGDVRATLEQRPEVLWEVVRLLAARLRVTDDALADAMFLDVPGRTAKRLLEIAGTADEFDMPLTQEELAGVVGASRERINRAIATFVKLGWLEVRGRSRYHILARDDLTARASS